MATEYVRDVPLSVVETLKERAAAEGKSLPAYIAAELMRVACSPTSAEVVRRLLDRDRNHAPDTATSSPHWRAGAGDRL